MRWESSKGREESSTGDPEKNERIKSCESILWGGRESKVVRPVGGIGGGFTSTRAGLVCMWEPPEWESEARYRRDRKKLSSSIKELTLAHESGDAQGARGEGANGAPSGYLRSRHCPTISLQVSISISTPTSIFRQEEAWRKIFSPVSDAGAPSQLGTGPLALPFCLYGCVRPCSIAKVPAPCLPPHPPATLRPDERARDAAIAAHEPATAPSRVGRRGIGVLAGNLGPAGRQCVERDATALGDPPRLGERLPH